MICQSVDEVTGAANLPLFLPLSLVATCSVVARSDKKKDGTVPLYLRLWQKDTRRRMSLGVRVEEHHWNEGRGEVRRTHPEHVRLNRFISEKLQAAERARRRLELGVDDFDAGDLKEAVRREIEGESPEDDTERALPYFRTLCDGYEREGKHSSAERYRQMTKKLSRFIESRSRKPEALRLMQIDVGFLRQFREWLSSKGGRSGTGLAHNTVAKHLKGLRTLYYTARREGKVEGANPFEHVTITEKAPAKVSLTRAELEDFEAADLSELGGSYKVRPAVARDMFCFACYAQGIRRSDCLMLTWGDIERDSSGEMKRLRYRMRKNDKPRNLVLVPPARALLKKYTGRDGGGDTWIFPALDGWQMATDEAEFNALNRVGKSLNSALREAADEVGLSKYLTFHVSRHTFARLADEAGWPLRKIQSALGHGKASTTERYLKQVRGEDLDSDMEKLF